MYTYIYIYIYKILVHKLNLFAIKKYIYNEVI